jgi:sugar lactone lactonase YvrE
MLFVADTQNSEIRAIPDAVVRPKSAGTGMLVSSGGMLNAPLGMAIAPNGHILTVNGNDGNIVETTPHGTQIANFLLDNSGGPPPGGGALFGLAIKPDNRGVYYVDDAANTLRLFH